MFGVVHRFFERVVQRFDDGGIHAFGPDKSVGRVADHVKAHVLCCGHGGPAFGALLAEGGE